MSMDMKGMKHSPKAHYQMAETLLAQGEDVVKRIGELSMERVAITSSKPNGELGALGPHDTARVEQLTRRMDEYGMKAIGTWLQAQVHATLATVDAEA